MLYDLFLYLLTLNLPYIILYYVISYYVMLLISYYITGSPTSSSKPALSGLSPRPLSAPRSMTLLGGAA